MFDQIDYDCMTALRERLRVQVGLTRHYNVSCSTGRIPLSNGSSSASHFQPEENEILRFYTRKGNNHTPQFLLAPLTPEAFEERVQNVKLTTAGKQRAEIVRRAIKKHPENFSRQVVTAYSALYNEILPSRIRQITIDYELFAPEFLIEVLQDKTSATHQLLGTKEGNDFILTRFSDVRTAWKIGETPFDLLHTTPKGPIQLMPYRGDLSPDTLCNKLKAAEIIPKSALNTLVFLLEAGLAPVGGMEQVLYATQIKERVLEWLKTCRPEDPRIDAFSKIPTDRSYFSLWGACSDDLCAPAYYGNALHDWRLTEATARDIMDVPGSISMSADSIVLNNRLLSSSEEFLDEETAREAFARLAEKGALVLVSKPSLKKQKGEASRKLQDITDPLLSGCMDRVLRKRPMFDLVRQAKTLRDYVNPLMDWTFQPETFPYARSLLGHIVNEIKICYGDSTAQDVKKQLEKNFSVETGVHVSLPRTMNRPGKPSSPIFNSSTLCYQAILLSAAAQLTTPLVPTDLWAQVIDLFHGVDSAPYNPQIQPLPSFVDWDKIRIDKNDPRFYEKLVPLGPFSRYFSIFTDGIYAGERETSCYTPGEIEGATITPFVRESLAERLTLANMLLPEGYAFLVFEGHREVRDQKTFFGRFANKLYEDKKGSFIEEKQGFLRPYTKEDAFSEAQKHWLPPDAENSTHTTGGSLDLTLVRFDKNDWECLQKLNRDQQYLLDLGLSESDDRIFEIELQRHQLFREKARMVPMGIVFDEVSWDEKGYRKSDLRYFAEKREREPKNPEFLLSEEEKQIEENRRLLHTIMTIVGFTPGERELYHFDLWNKRWATSTKSSVSFYGPAVRSPENLEFEQFRRDIRDLSIKASNPDFDPAKLIWGDSIRFELLRQYGSMTTANLDRQYRAAYIPSCPLSCKAM
jgi:D-alanyl-D-alanine dipeptidase